MVDYSKWDKLANDLGDDFELEDEDSKREWMSRWEILQKEQEDQFYGSETDKGKSSNLRRQLGLAEEEGTEEAGAEVAEQDASGAPRGKEHADPTRGQSTATRPGGGGGGGGGMDMKELLQLPIMQQALTGDLVDPEQEYLAMLAKEANSAAETSPLLSSSSSSANHPPSASQSDSQQPATQPSNTETQVSTRTPATPALPPSGWGRLGLPALGDTSEEAREKRLRQLRLWVEVASVEPEEEGDALRSLQQRSAVLQLIKLVFDPTFIAGMVELLLTTDPETVSATADLLSRLYVPFLSPTALPPNASPPPLSSLFLLYAKGGVLGASVRLLRSPSLPPTSALSLLCIFQSVLVFHPDAVAAVTDTTGLSTDTTGLSSEKTGLSTETTGLSSGTKGASAGFASGMLAALLAAVESEGEAAAAGSGGEEQSVSALIQDTALQCVAQITCLRLVEGVDSCFQKAVEDHAGALIQMARSRLGWTEEEEARERSGVQRRQPACSKSSQSTA